ncbi:MAG: glycosyl transferase family 2 [Candidatus Saganbacteria bacterium]|uniref:Glycosyl transferase family 2 n=1 Tax=Candidatus Saganbacteria bacterium TaxID=2575572 RepID=A0A833L1C3_UNCSA|nr:MAG: glycosyl transferase family 2 [Candidatus Saganbacteria bacterium]
MLISACMIVKNEEQMLQKTLPNLIKLVDEVILVDTGSSDKTIEIAKKLGAKVFTFPWINDFSAARNESLKHAQGEWIIWADADEFIKEEDMDKLKAQLANSKEIGYLLKVAECHEDDFNIVSFNLRPKVFKNKIGIHFERPINEQPFTKDGEYLFSQAKATDIPIYHWGGFLETEKLKQKKLRNIGLINKMIESGKGDVTYYFLLGLNYKDLKMYDESFKAYDEAIKIDIDGRFALAAREEKAWMYYSSKKAKEAYAEALEALKIDKQSITALNVVGGILLALDKYNDAVETLISAVNAPIKDDAVIVSPRQRDYVSRMLLGQTYMKMGKYKEALESAKKALQFDPTPEAIQLVKEAEEKLK